MNFDGGFGSKPGSESHAGLIYCCLGTLSITGKTKIKYSLNIYFNFSLLLHCKGIIFFSTGHLHLVDEVRLGWWLCERQLPSGGLNGRPEKLPDVCYSWWVLSSMSILGRPQWIKKQQLVRLFNIYRNI